MFEEPALFEERALLSKERALLVEERGLLSEEPALLAKKSALLFEEQPLFGKSGRFYPKSSRSYRKADAISGGLGTLIFEYLRDVFSRLPGMTTSLVKEMTPRAWAKARRAPSVDPPSSAPALPLAA